MNSLSLVWRGLICFGCWWAAIGPSIAGADDEPTVTFPAADIEFFEKTIRPILANRCYECHGPSSKGEGELFVDSRAALMTGGASGAAVVPGKPDESLLIDAVRYGDMFKMPPKSKLPADEIAALTRWVERGAPWPAEESESRRPTAAAEEGAEQSLWSLQPVLRPPLPAVTDIAWCLTPIDRFVLAELEQAPLSPASPAERRTLIRRVTFDLLGLPPTPAEIDAFLADEAADAYERLVERLLASPHYGERWGRHWLDVARYADSNGMDENLAYIQAFRYRDYVVAAFNDDLPYRDFLREQLAGDLLPPTGTAVDFRRIVATGFLSLGPKMLAEDDPVKMEMDIVDEQVDTLGRALIGMTLGCARCHDHKFDPISMPDYYALAGIFKSTKTMQNFSVVAAWNERPLATPEFTAQLLAAQQQVAQRKDALAMRLKQANLALHAAAQKDAALYLAAAKATGDLLQPASSLLRSMDPPPGSVLVEAEAFSSGNVQIDRQNYGKDIGVIFNGGPVPNVAEYEIDIPQDGDYQLEFRLAAADSRPVVCSVDGQVVLPAAASQVTGSWFPDTQTWCPQGWIALKAGRHKLRLERAGPFPHFDRLALLPRSLPAAARRLVHVPAPPAATETSPPQPLHPLVIERVHRYLTEAAREPRSFGFAWRGFGPESQDFAVAELPGDTVAAWLWREPRPTTAEELEARYGLLVTAALAAGPADEIPPAVLEETRRFLNDPQGPLAVPATNRVFLDAQWNATLAEEERQITAQESALPKPEMAMAVQEGQPTELRVHLRGNHLTLGKEPIARGVPSAMADSAASFPSSASGRLELAEWLTNGRHPLTARVMVNRLWRWHFGRGLVASTDNFGRLGDRPTHPELLDWLASEFVDSGWSLKHMQRLIVLSATYRQSSRVSAAALERDAENQRWSRQQRRRMEAEVVRDSLLMVSGQLDRTLGGSLLRSKHREYVAATSSVNTANYDTDRRSLYLPIVRSALYEPLQAFDFADPSALNGDRATTTVAPQALFMMNSRLVLDESRHWADRLLGMPGDDEQRLQAAWQESLGRLPTDAERAQAQEFLSRYQSTVREKTATPDAETLRREAWQGLCRALLATNEFIYIE